MSFVAFCYETFIFIHLLCTFLAKFIYSSIKWKPLSVAGHKLSSLGQISMLISFHRLHRHAVIAGNRVVYAIKCHSQFHTPEKKTTTVVFREPKKPLLHFSEPETRLHPTAKLCRGRRNSKARLSFHTITVSLWKPLSWNTLHCLLPGSFQRE